MNIDQIVDRLRELKWHIDDDGERQLREVMSAECVASDEAKLGAARYECVRAMNAHEFAELFRYCMITGMPFDAEVDRRRMKP
jgi:hypothetical protein